MAHTQDSAASFQHVVGQGQKALDKSSAGTEAPQGKKQLCQFFYATVGRVIA